MHDTKAYSRLHPLTVTGHVNLQVKGVVQHLRSEQVVLQIAAQLGKLQQLAIVKDGPEEQKHS